MQISCVAVLSSIQTLCHHGKTSFVGEIAHRRGRCIAGCSGSTKAFSGFIGVAYEYHVRRGQERERSLVMPCVFLPPPRAAARRRTGLSLQQGLRRAQSGSTLHPSSRCIWILRSSAQAVSSAWTERTSGKLWRLVFSLSFQGCAPCALCDVRCSLYQRIL